MSARVVLDADGHVRRGASHLFRARAAAAKRAALMGGEVEDLVGPAPAGEGPPVLWLVRGVDGGAYGRGGVELAFERDMQARLGL